MRNILNLIFKKQSFKRSHLNTTDGGSGGSPTLIFSDVGHGKTKPNRWVENTPKMRNLHKCQFSKNLANMKKKQKHTD